MREKDLRSWMHLRTIPTTKLASLTALPIGQRPPFLGGNRMGWILMELRREFTLRGVFPHKLPELTMSPEQILGSDSELEDMDMWDGETPVPHQEALWPNPFLLLAKRSSDKRLLTQALFRRPQPPWLRPAPPPSQPQPPHPSQPDQGRHPQDAHHPQPAPDLPPSPPPRKPERDFSAVTESEMEDMSEQELRAFILAYVAKLRGLHHTTVMQNQQLRYLESELIRLKGLREQLESEEREAERGDGDGRLEGEPSPAPKQQPQQRGNDGLTEEERNLRLVQQRMAQLVQNAAKAKDVEPEKKPSPIPERKAVRESLPLPKAPSPKVTPKPPSPKASKVPKEDAEDGEISSSDED